MRHEKHQEQGDRTRHRRGSASRPLGRGAVAGSRRNAAGPAADDGSMVYDRII